MQVQVKIDESWLIDALNGYLGEHGKSNRIKLFRLADERLVVQVDKLKFEVGSLSIKGRQVQLNVRALEYSIPIFGSIRMEIDSLRGRVVKLAADKLNLIPLLQFKDDLIVIDLGDYWPSWLPAAIAQIKPENEVLGIEIVAEPAKPLPPHSLA